MNPSNPIDPNARTRLVLELQLPTAALVSAALPYLARLSAHLAGLHLPVPGATEDDTARTARLADASSTYVRAHEGLLVVSAVFSSARTLGLILGECAALRSLLGTEFVCRCLEIGGEQRGINEALAVARASAFDEQVAAAYSGLMNYPARVVERACARFATLVERLVVFLPPVSGNPATLENAPSMHAVQRATIVYTVAHWQPLLLKHRHRALPTTGDTFNWDSMAREVTEHGTEKHDKDLRLARALYAAPADKAKEDA